tara:strand:+ start:25625 stop:26788 length:1164 start_codon:yes stop_codon:yes gene_type:complete
MKNKVLGIFKYPRAWNIDIINRFSNFYLAEYLYISDYKNKNFKEIISEINNLISSKKIETVLFDVDYFKFINFFFIKKINAKKKILITGDDFDQHEMHSITASACDIILSHCPLSVLKFREKGYESYLINFEISDLGNDNEKKEIDILFFGVITPRRKEILDYIENQGIKIKNLGHKEGEVGLSKEDLLKYISKTKIVLNLSQSRTTTVQNLASESIYKFYYQFKGRIILSGLKGALCVSEYSPGQEVLFNEKEIPTFYNKEECVAVLQKLLADNELFEKYKSKFITKVIDIYDEKKIFKPIYEAIERKETRKVNLVKFPYWYLRISAKQMIIRNINLFTLFKAIIEFNSIFSLIKGSSILIKVLIISESILNLLWYSIIRTFKPKN